MIIDRIDPLALRIPAPGGGQLCLTLARVTTSDGLTGYGECLSLRPPMQRALYATIRDAIAAGAGRVEWTVLPMQYEHLSPLANLVRPRPKGVEEGEEAGDTAAPSPQPPPLSSFGDPAGTERDWYRLVHRS
jgi:hypothetical protein